MIDLIIGLIIFVVVDYLWERFWMAKIHKICDKTKCKNCPFWDCKLGDKILKEEREKEKNKR